MLEKNLQTIDSRIAVACQLAQRSRQSVRLLAVSKRQHSDKIRCAYACGQRDFGENYLNEALEKQAQLADLNITWHFIGHIQSNKTRPIAAHFAWAHAVDSLKIAKRLSKQRPDDLSPINICLQINIDGEESKSGLAPAVESLLPIAKAIANLPRLRLRGLMCIPAPKTDAEQERATFTRMAQLQAHLNQQGLALDTLSMGMSDDLESAIACGANIVRIGTAIFGARQ